MAENWLKIQRKAKSSKIVLIDIAPNTPTSQLKTEKDVLNVGGFSDAVFDVANQFIDNSSLSWADIINKVSLDRIHANV